MLIGGWGVHRMLCAYSVASVMSDSFGILQAGILEWVAISSSRESSQTQGLNPSLLHWHMGLLLLDHGEVHRVEHPQTGLIKTQPWDCPSGLTGKNPSANTGNTGSVLVQEDPTCLRATRAMCQSLSALQPVLHHERSQNNEMPAHCN